MRYCMNFYLNWHRKYTWSKLEVHFLLNKYQILALTMRTFSGASSVPSEDGCKKSFAPQGGHQNHPLHYKKCIISINFSSFALSIWLFLTLVTFKNSATLLRTGACTHCLKSTGANAPVPTRSLQTLCNLKGDGVGQLLLI